MNFIRQRSSERVSRSAIEDQYIADNHTLLPYLQLFRMPSQAAKIGYVMTEPRTRNLIGIDLIDS